jgi:hypothetical protein
VTTVETRADTDADTDAGTGRGSVGRRSRTPRWLLAAAVLVALVPHAWMALGATGPVWMDDEVGYLGNAAFLAGVDLPQLASLGYWGGWSLSLVPLYWLGLSPGEVYAAAVAVSALYGALLVLPAHVLARSVGASPAVALVTGLVVAVVPDRTVMSNYALAENALVLTTMVAAACVARAVTMTSRRSAGAWFVAAAVASVLAFGIHPRAAMLVGAAGLVGLALLLRRGHRLIGLVVGVVSAAGGLAVYLANARLVSQVYAPGRYTREDDLVAKIMDLTPGVLLLPASGQAWYQAIAWGGLSLCGVAVAVVGLVTGLRRAGSGVLRDLYLVAAGVTTTLLSLMFVILPDGRMPARLDLYFYGRYLAHLAAVLAVVGLVWLVTRARWWHVVALVGSMAAITAAFVPRGGTYGDPERPFPPINVPGAMVLPWPALTDVPDRPLLGLSAVAVVVPVAVMLLRRRAWAVAALLVPASLVGTVAAATVSIDRFDAPFREGALPLRFTLSQLDEQGLVVTDAGPFARNGYVFWSETPVRAPGRNDPLTVAADDAVIAPDGDPRLEELGLRLVTCDRAADLCLHVPPGPLAAQAGQAGLLALPEGVPLPRRARVADLAVVATRSVPGVDGRELELAVRHAGTGVSWPALGERIDPSGVVRLLAIWEGGSALADLQRSLPPGDEATVFLRLPDLPDGSDVEVRLLVEGAPDLEFEGGTVDVVL